MPIPHIHRAMSLGDAPRLNFREPGIRGVNAQGSQMVPGLAGDYTGARSNPAVRNIPTASSGQWYGNISAKVGTGQTAAPQSPQMTLPRYRLGTVPKLATGTGTTARTQYTALGYVPGGYARAQYMKAGNGMGQMPGRHDSFDGTFGQGYPISGVAADSGRLSMAPTWQPHDFVVGTVFNRHGRQPGTWQETAYGPEYRSLKATQVPEVYNMGRSLAVHMARPLSQNVYFLGYQTPSSVAAQIGAAGMNIGSLGY